MVMKWVKAVAYERLLPKNRIKAASATILTFGSYGLGVRASFIILLVDDIVIMTLWALLLWSDQLEVVVWVPMSWGKLFYPA